MHFPSARLPARGHPCLPQPLSAIRGSLGSFPRTLASQPPVWVSPASGPFLWEPGQAGRAVPEQWALSCWEGLGLKSQPGGRTGPAAGKKRRSPEEAGPGGRGGKGTPPPPTRLGESRGAFVPCRPRVATWCSSSLSQPGTEGSRGEPGLQGQGQRLGVIHLHPACPPLPVPLLCVALWVGTASGTVTPAWEMPPGPHTCPRTPRSCDLQTVAQRSAHHAGGPGTRNPASHTHTSPDTAKPHLGTHVYTQTRAQNHTLWVGEGCWGLLIPHLGSSHPVQAPAGWGGGESKPWLVRGPLFINTAWLSLGAVTQPEP